MFELSIIGHFAAAHLLRGYDGPCQNLHGHTWRVEVSVASPEVNDLGMVCDFKVLKKKLHEFLSGLDHLCLNDLPAFKEINPTTENLARHIYREFARMCLPLAVTRVRVWESDTASVTYYE